MSTILTGASDDLIEVDGDITEELGYRDIEGKGDLVAFSTGTVLRIRYDQEGIWRITHVAGPPPAVLWSCPEDGPVYSDRAEVEGAKWAVHGTAIAKATR